MQPNMTVQVVEASWKELHSALRAQKLFGLQAFLSSGKLETVRGDVLIVAFPAGYDLHKEKVESDHSILEAILEQSLGHSVQLRCVIEDGQKPPTKTVPAEKQKPGSDTAVSREQIQPLEHTLVQDQAKLHQVGEQLRAEKARLQTSREMLQRTSDDVQKGSKAQEALREQKASLEREISQLKHSREQLSLQIQNTSAQAENKAATLQQEIRALQAKRIALQQEVGALDMQKTKLEDELAERSQEGRQLAELLQELQNEIAQIETRKSEIDSKTTSPKQKDPEDSATTPDWLKAVVGDRTKPSGKAGTRP